MFNHHLRLLAFVPRWQIAPRFRTQNVAEHSFFVGLYTSELLKHKWHWSAEQKLQAMECALMHDIAEARTGDMPGPVKRAVTDPAKLSAYETEQLEIMGIDHPVCDAEVLDLVKVADLIDEAFHVAMEISMGNGLIVRQMQITMDRFHAAVRRAKLPWEVASMVEEEIARMQQGFHLPANTPATDPLTADALIFENSEIPFD